MMLIMSKVRFGLWRGAYTCIIMSCCYIITGQCPVLAPIPNGAISYGPDMMADFDVGTLATYSCDRGFVLFGSETQLCIGGGIWSKEPPECQRKIHLWHWEIMCRKVIIIGSIATFALNPNSCFITA